MKIYIKHEIQGRIRFHMDKESLTVRQADMLLYYITSIPGVRKGKVYERTGNGVIWYEGDRREILERLSGFRWDEETILEMVPKNTGRALNQEYKEKLIQKVVVRLFTKTFLPAPLRAAYVVFRSVKYLYHGIRCLVKGQLKVEVLDATAIAVSILRGDTETAGSVMFLLGIGELLEEWTHKNQWRIWPEVCLLMWSRYG
mgnify:FL=1